VTQQAVKACALALCTMSPTAASAFDAENFVQTCLADADASPADEVVINPFLDVKNSAFKYAQCFNTAMRACEFAPDVDACLAGYERSLDKSDAALRSPLPTQIEDRGHKSRSVNRRLDVWSNGGPKPEPLGAAEKEFFGKWMGEDRAVKLLNKAFRVVLLRGLSNDIEALSKK